MYPKPARLAGWAPEVRDEEIGTIHKHILNNQKRNPKTKTKPTNPNQNH